MGHCYGHVFQLLVRCSGLENGGNALSQVFDIFKRIVGCFDSSNHLGVHELGSPDEENGHNKAVTSENGDAGGVDASDSLDV